MTFCQKIGYKLKKTKLTKTGKKSVKNHHINLIAIIFGKIMNGN